MRQRRLLQPHFQWTEGNSIDLLECGEKYFPALIDEIKKAEKEILFQTYIFSPGKTGESVIEALCAAGQKGVDVHLVLDSFGSAYFPKEWRDKLESARVRIVFFRPILLNLWNGWEVLHRLHRKVVVIDTKVVLIGGINIDDDQWATIDPKSRYDMASRVRGPLVDLIHHQCLIFHRRMERNWKDFIHLKQETALPVESSQLGNQKAAYIVRDNFKNRHSIEKIYRTELKAAKKEVYIANAYFFPNLRFLRALRKAAKRGVKVHLILQGRSEFLILKIATERLYRSLLKYGVRIYEYQPRLFHAKVAAIDELWCTVGSFNLDPFSLAANLEANIMVSDPKLNQELRSRLARIISEDCLEIQKAHPAPWRIFLGFFSFYILQLLPGLLRAFQWKLVRKNRRKSA